MNQANIANFVSIVVVVISGFFALASSRSASKATRYHDETNYRLEMERDAYDRARKLDTDTITRQGAEIELLRNHETKLVNQVFLLKLKVDRLIRLLPPDVKEKFDAENRRAGDDPAVPE